jgi:mRNA interferase RelE/StbE
MRVVFDRLFDRDLDRVRDGAVLKRVFEFIGELESCARLADVAGIKRLVGFGDFYRARFGDYRLGFRVERDGTATLARFLHRKDIYRAFP